MATALTTAMASNTLDLCLGDHDGVWEIACSPHSWLSEACGREGLKPRRINLEQGYDLYRSDTRATMGKLFKLKRPKRLWFSLPCTKWCQWTYLNFHDRPEELRQARKKERRMLWCAQRFLHECLTLQPDTLVYWEWTHPCQGWTEHPMVAIEKLMMELSYGWFQCRVDGCVYGMRDVHGVNLVHKKWMIKTNDEAFHASYKTKVCHGGHQHTVIQGGETARSAYYPWKLVCSWAKFWRKSYVSDRQLRLLYLQGDGSQQTEEDELERMLEVMDSPGDSAAIACFPAVSQEEPSQAEREQWTSRIAHFHRAAGHPTNKNLARLVKEAGQPQWKVEAVMQHKCQACESLRPGEPPVAASRQHQRALCGSHGRLWGSTAQSGRFQESSARSNLS